MDVKMGSAAIDITVVSSNTDRCPVDNVVVLNMPDGTTMNQTYLETNVVASVTNAKIEA